MQMLQLRGMACLSTPIMEARAAYIEARISARKYNIEIVESLLPTRGACRENTREAMLVVNAFGFTF